MTRVHGQLFSDGRNGLLVVKPSQPFFGVARHERHFDVTDGSIDINLDPTPAGVTYLVAYKEKGTSVRPTLRLSGVCLIVRLMTSPLVLHRLRAPFCRPVGHCL